MTGDCRYQGGSNLIVFTRCDINPLLSTDSLTLMVDRDTGDTATIIMRSMFAEMMCLSVCMTILPTLMQIKNVSEIPYYAMIKQCGGEGDSCLPYGVRIFQNSPGGLWSPRIRVILT